MRYIEVDNPKRGSCWKLNSHSYSIEKKREKGLTSIVSTKKTWSSCVDASKKITRQVPLQDWISQDWHRTSLYAQDSWSSMSSPYRPIWYGVFPSFRIPDMLPFYYHQISLVFNMEKDYALKNEKDQLLILENKKKASNYMKK